MKSKEIIIGRNCKIDKTAIIGYRPQRRLTSKKIIIGQGACIRSNTVIYMDVKIGNNLNTGHNVIIREQNYIGNDFKIWSNSIVDYGCKIAHRVKVHSNVYIAQFTSIEDDVFLAPGVVIANDLHPRCKYSQKCLKGPMIKKAAIIGVNVTILPRIVIGKHSFIGAGSVVTRDIPDFAVAFGNPAKIQGTIKDLKCSTGITNYPYRY